ncbi:MAG: Membrane-associated Zn-dependent protease [candidate division WS6 bacterium GW2011_GWE1_34_7]|uniref:Membrane-associated Zn-dependent protease n=1 Tax=candidate division WS6 bacterium GW2011_GWE1_34_7 TaxID=1619093 RepID=A0A0G0B7Y4_9BACT|nr:MAG: Membrane-associated Zn-dependent protease [candidate division WS6 bacterium GW2011_GWE1_34_7]
MSTIINILLLLLVISILTFVHELGHFLAAKLVKARVFDFSIGFGPSIFSKKYKGTVYNLRILPFGGYVKILGDGDPTGNKEDIKSKGNLKNKSKLAQMFVMLAGVTMNILLAIILYTIFLANNGWKMSIGSTYEDFKPVGATIERERMTNLPYELADEGGALDSNMYEKGYILSIDGEEIDDYRHLVEVLKSNKSEEINIYACDMDEECNFFDVVVSEEGKIGVYTGENYDVYIDYSQNKISAGASHSLNIVKLTGQVFGSMLSQAKDTGDYSELSNTVSGPIGIYFIIDYFKTLGIIMFLGILADLSISLAVINLLPIPALDGGRFFILLIESILRKDLNEKVESAIINISFMLLIVLIVLVMIKDIINIQELKSLFK